MKTFGLSLAEAHASGRRYKHKDDTSFTRFRDIELVCFTYAVSKEWELEPEAKLLTRQEVEHAFSTSWSSQAQMYMREVLLDTLFGEEE